MVLKSYAKINLSLIINKKLHNGLHNLQSYYSLINFYDEIYIKKTNKFKDNISFFGTYSKFVNPNNNTIKKTLNILRKNKIISKFYSIKIKKKIPVFAGLGGGTSNAAAVIKFFIKKKINQKILNEFSRTLGSDLRLFFYNQGYLQGINSIIKSKKKFNFNIVLIYPKLKCSTKEIYSKFKNVSHKERYKIATFSNKKLLINYLINSKNDLQVVVEKKYPKIKRILSDINQSKGCIFSRMTGSGSACYGLFKSSNYSKVALKKLRKKYPKFSISIAKTL